LYWKTYRLTKNKTIQLQGILWKKQLSFKAPPTSCCDRNTSQPEPAHLRCLRPRLDTEPCSDPAMLDLKHTRAVGKTGGIGERFPSPAGADKRARPRGRGGEGLSEISSGSRKELRQLREMSLMKFKWEKETFCVHVSSGFF